MMIGPEIKVDCLMAAYQIKWHTQTCEHFGGVDCQDRPKLLLRAADAQLNKLNSRGLWPEAKPDSHFIILPGWGLISVSANETLAIKYV